MELVRIQRRTVIYRNLLDSDIYYGKLLIIMQLTDEQLRGLANAGQLYETWKGVMSALSKLPGGMYWRVINSKEYLYQYASGEVKQQTKYVAPKTPESEEKFRNFQEEKQDLEHRRAGIEGRIGEFTPVWRALRLPAIDTTAGSILRAIDQTGELADKVLVIGTYALKAYEVEAAATFATGMDATDDLDFTLFADNATLDPDLPRRLLLKLKQVDSSFVVSPDSSKTVVNNKGYLVDLLTNKNIAGVTAGVIPWKPECLEGQEWLALGTQVRTVLIDFQGWPVPIHTPDPRFFALHKLWLGNRRGRPAKKAAKDKRQGLALLETIKNHMPHFPMDENFMRSLPDQLREQMPGQSAAS